LNVIAHIRKATVGQVMLENTHPFVREMWGRYWTFAHNGTLKDYAPAHDAAAARFRPVGGTDSETAFCDILETLWRRFPDGAPSAAAMYAAVEDAARRIAAHGDFNFLLSDGETLFARCATRLSYIVRRAPFTKAHLTDEDYTVDFGLVTTPNDRVAVIATTPLTDNEAWTPIAPGALLMFRDGEPAAAPST
jgi:glutamine amidotransferase